MVELVDTLDLGPSDFCFVGSSPTVCNDDELFVLKTNF